MDYNYVRMRNALKAGDKDNAEHYRRLFEKRRYKKEDTKGLNILLVILSVFAVVLGIYSVILMNSPGDSTEPQPTETTVPEQEYEDIGELPIVGASHAPATEAPTAQ